MFVVLLLSACLCASALSVSATYYNLEDAPSHFEDFINKYNKQYEHEKEKETRFHIFVDNLKDVNRMNNASEHTVYGITKFMDLTPEEFKAKFTGLKASKGLANSKCRVLTDADMWGAAALEHDWRYYKVVGPVKDQGKCGSCYAFSSTGHIEGQYALKYGSLISLSEQQILDCDQSSKGCDGGVMSDVYSSLIKMGGIEKESDYPYQAAQSNCTFDKNKVAAIVKQCYQYNLTLSFGAQLLVFTVGPISISIDATPLHKYHGGILKNKDCQGEVNHAVLLVGYGKGGYGEDDYWIVKNSWGEDWGEDGYFNMERKEGQNACGMLNNQMTSVDIE